MSFSNWNKKGNLKSTEACLGLPPSLHSSVSVYPVLLHVALALAPHVFHHVAQEVCKKCKLYYFHVCPPSECGCACWRVTSLPLLVGRCPRAGAEVTVSLSKQARPGQPGIAGPGGDNCHVRRAMSHLERPDIWHPRKFRLQMQIIWINIQNSDSRLVCPGSGNGHVGQCPTSQFLLQPWMPQLQTR